MPKILAKNPRKSRQVDYWVTWVYGNFNNMGFSITWFFSRCSPSRWYCKTVVFCPGSTVKRYFLSQKTLAKNPGQKSGPKSGQKSGHADHVLKTQLYWNQKNAIKYNVFECFCRFHIFPHRQCGGCKIFPCHTRSLPHSLLSSATFLVRERSTL